MIAPFSHLLNKCEIFIWDAKCQQALENIKRYLSNSPILAPYNSKMNLLFYVSATTLLPWIT